MELRENKPKRCHADEAAVAGARWDHTAVTADRQRVVSLGVGQRTQAPSRTLGTAPRARLRPGHLPAICTEAYEGYAAALLDAFGRRYPAPHGPTGRPRRLLLRWPQGLAEGQVKTPSQGRGIAPVAVRGL